MNIITQICKLCRTQSVESNIYRRYDGSLTLFYYFLCSKSVKRLARNMCYEGIHLFYSIFVIVSHTSKSNAYSKRHLSNS